jgi:hypothetical protein
MTLPPPVEALWRDLERARAEILGEVEGLSQAQADWRATPQEWSIGEILHHLTLAEVATGKLTSKLLKEAGPELPRFPADLTTFAPLPPWPTTTPREAPPVVRPEAGQAIGPLLADMKAARARSRQSLERVAAVDPRKLSFPHFALGTLDLAQWWMLQARHDGDHLQQLRGVKSAAGFPRR